MPLTSALEGLFQAACGVPSGKGRFIARPKPHASDPSLGPRSMQIDLRSLFSSPLSSACPRDLHGIEQSVGHTKQRTSETGYFMVLEPTTHPNFKGDGQTKLVKRPQLLRGAMDREEDLAQDSEKEASRRVYTEPRMQGALGLQAVRFEASSPEILLCEPRVCHIYSIACVIYHLPDTRYTAYHKICTVCHSSGGEQMDMELLFNSSLQHFLANHESRCRISPKRLCNSQDFHDSVRAAVNMSGKAKGHGSNTGTLVGPIL